MHYIYFKIYKFKDFGRIILYYSSFKENFSLFDLYYDNLQKNGKNTYVNKQQLNTVRRSQYAKWLEDFERVWGKVETQRQLVHFLLKYKYTQNWDREVNENYFPIFTEDFMKRIPNSYRIVYKDIFTLPYTSWQIRKDFGFELTDNTHIKLVLERKD